MKIGPRIHRIGSGLVNSYLVEEAGEVPNPAKTGPTRLVPLLRFLWFGVTHGALERIEAGWLLPGHGQPWTGGVGEALSRIKNRAHRSHEAAGEPG